MAGFCHMLSPSSINSCTSGLQRLFAFRDTKSHAFQALSLALETSSVAQALTLLTPLPHGKAWLAGKAEERSSEMAE